MLTSIESLEQEITSSVLGKHLTISSIDQSLQKKIRAAIPLPENFDPTIYELLNILNIHKSKILSATKLANSLSTIPVPESFADSLPPLNKAHYQTLRLIEKNDPDAVNIQIIADLIKAGLIEELPPAEKILLEKELVDLQEKRKLLFASEENLYSNLDYHKFALETDLILKQFTVKWFRLITRYKLLQQLSVLQKFGVPADQTKLNTRIQDIEQKIAKAFEAGQQTDQRISTIEYDLQTFRPFGQTNLRLTLRGLSAIPENKIIGHLLQVKEYLQQIKLPHHNYNDFNDLAFHFTELTAEHPEKLASTIANFLRIAEELRNQQCTFFLLPDFNDLVTELNILTLKDPANFDQIISHFLKVKKILSQPPNLSCYTIADLNNIALEIAKMTLHQPQKLDRVIAHYHQSKGMLGNLKDISFHNIVDFNDIALRMTRMTIDQPKILKELIEHFLQAIGLLHNINYTYSNAADLNDIAFRITQKTFDQPQKLEEVTTNYVISRNNLAAQKGFIYAGPADINDIAFQMSQINSQPDELKENIDLYLSIREKLTKEADHHYFTTNLNKIAFRLFTLIK